MRIGGGMLLHHMFIRTAKTFGRKTAIIDRTAGRKLSYRRALTASLLLTDKFRAYEPGCIGILLPASAAGTLSILGSLMSGRTPVLINYSTGAAGNCAYAQKRCAFRTIVTSRTLLAKLGCGPVEGMVFIEDIVGKVTLVDKIRASWRARLPLGRLLAKVHEGSEEDPSAILFTSGSEREPKAVPLSHRNIWSNIEGTSQIFALSAQDIMVANLPCFHVFGLTIQLWLPLYHGMTIVSWANPLDSRTICRIVREESATILVGSPSFMWGYLNRSEPGDFATLRIALTGADKCPEALRQEFRRKHGIVLYEGYGTTETGPVIAANTPASNRPGSVGRVLPNMRVRVEHYETGEECRAGEMGRILVRGPNVINAYFDDFERTAMSIRRGWYDTGDMGYLDEDGYLWHAGRLRRFVKVGGEMISLVRVENTLEELLPAGVECCVVGVPDPTKGARVVAAITGPIDERSVLKRMAETLPGVALPKQFVVVSELARMSSGKIDFRQVTESVRDMVRARQETPAMNV